MVRRIDTRGLRKKPARPKKEKIGSIQDWFKKSALTAFIWLLVGANLIFIVSMVFQTLNSTGGERVVQSNVKSQKAKITQRKIKIEVLNGCGVNGIAAELREYLIDRKFDVIDFKNYERFDIPETLVIDRKYMDKRYARKIADAIGVKKKQIFPQISPQRKLDVSVIIGRNYKDLKAFK